MNNRTIGTILTVLAVLIFGCPGFIFLCSGLVSALVGLSGDPEYYLGIDTEPRISLVVGLSMICLSVILIGIPIILGLFTIRGKSQPDEDEVTTIDSQVYEPRKNVSPTDQIESEETKEDIPPAI
jgi:hypothetical protein